MVWQGQWCALLIRVVDLTFVPFSAWLFGSEILKIVASSISCGLHCIHLCFILWAQMPIAYKFFAYMYRTLCFLSKNYTLIACKHIGVPSNVLCISPLHWGLLSPLHALSSSLCCRCHACRKMASWYLNVSLTPLYGLRGTPPNQYSCIVKPCIMNWLLCCKYTSTNVVVPCNTIMSSLNATQSKALPLML